MAVSMRKLFSPKSDSLGKEARMVDRNRSEPLYFQIIQDIRQQILSGQIKIGDKLMSESEMIRHYQVGRVTIRNALSELVRSGCLRKEQGAGTFCVGLPRMDDRKNIDVLLNTGDRIFTPYFLTGISRILNENNCNLILHDTQDDMANIGKLLEQVMERGTDGIILQPYTGTEEILPECIRALDLCRERKIPIVTIDGKFKDIDTAYIVNNDEGGCEKATAYLIGMGHRNILGLFRNRFRDSKFRAMGYRKAMEKAGLTAQILDADEMGSSQWVDYIRARGVTAIVCYNDYLAVKCYHRFHEKGLQPGQDISIIGFDDTEVSRSALPRISTVTHPKDIMGQQAAMYLLDRINGTNLQPEQYVFPSDLICRDSVCNISTF